MGTANPRIQDAPKQAYEEDDRERSESEIDCEIRISDCEIEIRNPQSAIRNPKLIVMPRSVKKGPWVDKGIRKTVERIRAGSQRPQVIRTWSRRSTITPDMV